MNERYKLNAQLAQMLKGGVIMDVTNPEQARIAEAAGACAVMALEKIPADIRAPYIEAVGEGVQVLANCYHAHHGASQCLRTSAGQLSYICKLWRFRRNSHDLYSCALY